MLFGSLLRFFVTGSHVELMHHSNNRLPCTAVLVCQFVEWVLSTCSSSLLQIIKRYAHARSPVMRHFSPRY